MRGGRNASSFDAFFYAERSSLVRQAYVLTGDLHLAQDLAQEALVRAWASWGKVERYDRPGSWARKVLFNLAFNERRRRGRAELVAFPDGGVHLDEDHLVILEALEQLPVMQQKALVLHDAVGLEVREVALELGVPEGTVKSWLSRGRQRLAAALRDETEPRRP